MSVVEERYAKALFDLAVSEKRVSEYQNDLFDVSQIYEKEKRLNIFLSSPKNNLTTKKAVLINVFRGKVKKNTLNLLLLLLSKGRIEILPGIYSAYVKMSDEYRNILSITVTAALPLNKAQVDRIGEKFKAIYKGSFVKITVKTDRSLIGGVKVAVGDKIYDGTIQGKLLKMKSAIAEQ